MTPTGSSSTETDTRSTGGTIRLLISRRYGQFFIQQKKIPYFSVGVTPPTVTRGTTVGTAETDGE